MRAYYPHIYLPTDSQKGRQAEIHVRREKDSTHALIDPQMDWQRDRQWNRQSDVCMYVCMYLENKSTGGKSIVQQHWLVRIRQLQRFLFLFFLSLYLWIHACMQSVCLSTHMIIRMYARAHTYQPTKQPTDRQTDRQTERLTDRQSARQPACPHALSGRKKERNSIFLTFTSQTCCTIDFSPGLYILNAK